MITFESQKNKIMKQRKKSIEQCRRTANEESTQSQCYRLTFIEKKKKVNGQVYKNTNVFNWVCE